MRHAAKHQLQPSFEEGNAASRLAAFISEMKALQVYPGVTWDNVEWDITASDKTARGHLASKKQLIFAEHSSTHTRQGVIPLSKRVALVASFSDLVKACIARRYADRGMGPGVQRVFLRAARYLYGALALPARRDPTLISRGHFVAAEAAVLEREAKSSAYRVSVFLDELARMLDRRGVCRAPLNFRASIPRGRDEFDRTTATFAERTENLPSRDLIEALATVANDPRVSQEPFDLLRIRIVELLIIGGFRIGEALTMPADVLVREPMLDELGNRKRNAVTGELLERIGIRYWPEKAGEPIPKWVPTIANAQVLRAVRDIDDLCRPARENASWLECHPNQIKLEIDNDKEFSTAQAASILGLGGYGAFQSWLRGNARGGHALLRRTGDRYSISGANLKCAIAQDRFTKPMLVKPNGRQQSLGESLIVCFLNAGHSGRAVNRFITNPMTWDQIASFISGRPGKAPIRSIFERYDLTDESGAPYRVRTHDFRRLLNTVAQRGGLTQAEIALWMGRRRVEDNAAYDLRSSVEMAAEMRQLVEKNEVYGTIADQVRALPETEREAFLNSRLTMLHTTPLGQCGSNIAENPCATAVSCLGGCGHYLRRKGDERSRVALLRIECETLDALERAEALSIKGNAINWIRGHETVLKHARAALAIDTDFQITDGELRHVNPGGPIIGKPL